MNVMFCCKCLEDIRMDADIKGCDRKITVTHVIDEKLKRESFPVVSASAITSVINELLPKKGEDHGIDIVPRSSLRNKPLTE